MGRVLLTTRYNFLEFFTGFHHFPQLINPVRVLSDPSLGVIHIFESCTKTYNNTYLHKINFDTRTSTYLVQKIREDRMIWRPILKKYFKLLNPWIVFPVFSPQKNVFSTSKISVYLFGMLFVYWLQGLTSIDLNKNLKSLLSMYEKTLLAKNMDQKLKFILKHWIIESSIS